VFHLRRKVKQNRHDSRYRAPNLTFVNLTLINVTIIYLTFVNLS